MTDVFHDLHPMRRHRDGWSIRVGSPEGYTSLGEVSGAPPDLVSQVAQLMTAVAEDDVAAPYPGPVGPDA